MGGRRCQAGFARGVDTGNPRQAKRLFADMCMQEKMAVVNRRAREVSANRFRMSPHVKAKLASGDFQFQSRDLWSCLRYGNVIELSYVDGMERVLLRDALHPAVVPVDGEDVLCDLCVVLEYASNSIVTMYWNSHDDEHATLDRSKYVG